MCSICDLHGHEKQKCFVDDSMFDAAIQSGVLAIFSHGTPLVQNIYPYTTNLDSQKQLDQKVSRVDDHVPDLSYCRPTNVFFVTYENKNYYDLFCVNIRRVQFLVVLKPDQEVIDVLHHLSNVVMRVIQQSMFRVDSGEWNSFVKEISDTIRALTSRIACAK